MCGNGDPLAYVKATPHADKNSLVDDIARYTTERELTYII